MATKTFKIGLSNTDKQNMAQDVYERVLALTFAEYDSANTYNKGDFVVYDDTLYQCKQDNTTGTWDSSKWQQATLQDLLDDIEGAVAFVNDKANVDGNYPTMTVGAADNLTPYDEDSGTDQEQPFLLQGTGCGNGEQQVDTGALALLKEKQGNSVVVNQLARPLNATYWNAYQGTPTFTDGTCELTPIVDAQYPGIIQTTLLPKSGHYYLVNLDFKGEATLNINFGGVDTQIASGLNTSVFTNITKLVLCNNESAYLQLFVVDGTNVQNYKNIICIDLTQWFGSNDNIPAHLLSHPEDFFRYYQGSLAYNEGTLVNANGRYLKTIGRQQWDEEWEEGSIDQAGNAIVGSAIHSKNLIKVIPNTDYYFKVGTGGYLIIDWFDKDGNNVGYLFGYGRNDHYKAPANAVSMKFAVVSGYGTTYNHDITISIYYEGESGYDQYYPYEELANIDTGTETLRSAGSVYDVKLPTGEIKRNIGVVDLSTLSWVKSSSYTNSFFYASLSDRKSGLNNNLLCGKYNLFTSSFASTFGDDAPDKSICFGRDTDSTQIYIRDDSLTGTDEPTGILFYELAEPTTEQGTTFSENVAIDDFGSMDFGGTNSVPQGASIFYAVDYKAFIDSLYNTLDGDATDIVKESELDTKLAALGYVKLTSVSGYDATKTQVLKNVEGTLAWVTEE